MEIIATIVIGFSVIVTSISFVSMKRASDSADVKDIVHVQTLSRDIARTSSVLQRNLHDLHRA